MTVEVKKDWRLRSQARGLRVLSLALPLLLIGLYGGSQRSRTVETIIWEQMELQPKTEQFSIRIGGSQTRQVPLQFQLQAKSLTAQVFPRTSVQYEVWNQRRELITRRQINLQAEPQGLESRALPSMLLEGNQRYLLRMQIRTNSDGLRQLKNWQIKLVKNPLKPSDLWLQGLEILVYPALSVTLLAMVMIFGPRLIR